MGIDRFCDTHSLRGMKIARAFIDVSEWRRDQYARDGRFMEMLMTIKCRGGDII
jgi:hypothetical protein